MQIPVRLPVHKLVGVETEALPTARLQRELEMLQTILRISHNQVFPKVTYKREFLDNI